MVIISNNAKWLVIRKIIIIKSHLNKMLTVCIDQSTNLDYFSDGKNQKKLCIYQLDF